MLNNNDLNDTQDINPECKRYAFGETFGETENVNESKNGIICLEQIKWEWKLDHVYDARIERDWILDV